MRRDWYLFLIGIFMDFCGVILDYFWGIILREFFCGIIFRECSFISVLCLRRVIFIENTVIGFFHSYYSIPSEFFNS